MERQTIIGSLSTSGRLSGQLSVGGGTTDYNELENKPTYNDHIIEGDLTSESLGIWQPKNFSTEEQNTGIKWIDGKDIYVKSYQVNNAIYDASYFGIIIATNVNFIDTLIDIKGSIKNNNNNAIASLFGLLTNGWYGSFHINPTGVLMIYSDNLTLVNQISGNCKISCTLFYTKN